MKKNIQSKRILDKALVQIQYIAKDVNEIVYAKDREGRFLYFNREFLPDLGIPSKKLLTKKINDVRDAQFLTPFIEKDKEVIQKLQVKIFETSFQVNGTKKYYLNTKIPLMDDEGKCVGLWGIRRDITAEKESEKASILETEQQARRDAELARNKLYRLQYVTSALAQALTPKEIAEIAVTLGAATLSASAGSVWLFDKEKKLQNVSYTGYKKEAMDGIEAVREKDITPTLDSIRRKKPIILRSLEDRKQAYPHTLRLFEISQKEGFIAIPLLVGESVLGAINFAFDSHKDFTPEEQEFIFTLTQQCAQALDRARLYEEEKDDREKVEEAAERVRKLQKITEELTNTLTLTDIEKIVISTVKEMLGVSSGALFLLSPDGKTLQTLIMEGVSEDMRNELKAYPVQRGIPGVHTIIPDKAIFVESRQEHKKRYPKTGKGSAFESFASLPLIIREKVLGVLNFGFPMRKLFTPEDKEFLLNIASQSSQALERTMLYESEKHKKEEKEASLIRLNALQEVTKLLSQARTPQEVASIIVESGTKVLGGEAGEVVVIAEDFKSFRPIAYKGFPRDVRRSYEFVDIPFHKHQKLFIADTFKKNIPIFISDWDDVPSDYRTFFHTMRRINCRSAAYIPLRIQDKIIGVLDLAFKDKKVFTNQEKEFMMTLAENCAQALDRAYGYQKIEDYAKETEKREARFRSLIENSSDAIILIDKNLNILYHSQSSQRITGEDPTTRLGQPVLNVIKEEDKEKVKKWLKTLIRQPEGKPVTIRFRRFTKNGNRDQWIEATGSNFIHNPAIDALVANYRDVTDSMEAEEALRRSRDELDIILQNVIDAVIVTDANGQVVYANPAAFIFERFSTLESVKNTNYSEMLSNFKGFYDEGGHPIPLQKMPIQRILSGEEYVTQIMRIEFNNGTDDQWRLVKASPVYDEKENIVYVVSIYSDITEEKQKEKLKDEFISTASHELKTPITSAKLYAGILQNRLEEIRDEKAFGMLSKVDVQLDRLTHLINDLLDVSKISAGKIQFRMEKISLDTLVREIVEEMQFTTVSHTIQLTGSTKSFAYGDRERLRQVLINLVSNAIKYSPKSDTVDIMLIEGRKLLKICVRDYGIGIRQENLEKIFEPFFRESYVEGARFPGLGLGLHISSEIIKRHNGTIWVESTYGKGSTFCVTLPKVNEKDTRY